LATNLHLDEKLLAVALRLSGKKTKRETVNDALAEYVARRKQKEILGLAGKIDFDPQYDYKKLRSRK
jgi:Arc/MetJ family transcription regulator